MGTARGPAVALLLCVVPNLSVRIIARNNPAVKPDRICECVDYLGTGGTLESMALDPNKRFAMTTDTSDPAASSQQARFSGRWSLEGFCANAKVCAV